MPKANANMATVPWRQDIVGDAVRSLESQVGAVQVVFGPVHGRSDDARKFHGHPTGYVLICDDDLRYPHDFAEHMVAAVDRYDRKALICIAGRVVNGKSTSYYRDQEWATKYDWRKQLGRDMRVHIPITCAIAFHTDAITFRFPDDFPGENMADIWVGAKCARLGVPVVRVDPPRLPWLELLPTDPERTIYRQHRNDCEAQTAAVNSVVWPVL